jgi:hypothetical protein
MNANTYDSVTNTQKAVGTLPGLPVGQYLVNAHVIVENTGAPLNVTCSLAVGSGASRGFDTETTSIGNTAGFPQIAPLTLEAGAALSSSGTATVSCQNTFDTRTVTLSNVWITAIQAASLTNAPFNGPFS